MLLLLLAPTHARQHNLSPAGAGCHGSNSAFRNPLIVPFFFEVHIGGCGGGGRCLFSFGWIFTGAGKAGVRTMGTPSVILRPRHMVFFVCIHYYALGYVLEAAHPEPKPEPQPTRTIPPPPPTNHHPNRHANHFITEECWRTGAMPSRTGHAEACKRMLCRPSQLTRCFSTPHGESCDALGQYAATCKLMEPLVQPQRACHQCHMQAQHVSVLCDCDYWHTHTR